MYEKLSRPLSYLFLTRVNHTKFTFSWPSKWNWNSPDENSASKLILPTVFSFRKKIRRFFCHRRFYWNRKAVAIDISNICVYRTPASAFSSERNRVHRSSESISCRFSCPSTQPVTTTLRELDGFERARLFALTRDVLDEGLDSLFDAYANFRPTLTRETENETKPKSTAIFNNLLSAFFVPFACHIEKTLREHTGSCFKRLTQW